MKLAAIMSYRCFWEMHPCMFFAQWQRSVKDVHSKHVIIISINKYISVISISLQFCTIRQHYSLNFIFSCHKSLINLDTLSLTFLPACFAHCLHHNAWHEFSVIIQRFETDSSSAPVVSWDSKLSTGSTLQNLSRCNVSYGYNSPTLIFNLKDCFVHRV